MVDGLVVVAYVCTSLYMEQRLLLECICLRGVGAGCCGVCMCVSRATIAFECHWLVGLLS